MAMESLVAKWWPVSYQMACACRRAAEEASQNLRKLDSRAAAAVKTAKQAASMLKVGCPSSMLPQAWMHVLAGHAPWHQHLGCLQVQLMDQSALQQDLARHDGGQHLRACRSLRQD